MIIKKTSAGDLEMVFITEADKKAMAKVLECAYKAGVEKDFALEVGEQIQESFDIDL